MKYLPLVWRNLWRRMSSGRRSRSAAVFIAFMLYGLLMTIRAAFTIGVDVAGLDRLVLINKISHHAAAADLVPGATSGHRPASSSSRTATWFSGIYQDNAEFSSRTSPSTPRRT